LFGLAANAVPDTAMTVTSARIEAPAKLVLT
jgi:hypothetical protein